MESFIILNEQISKIFKQLNDWKELPKYQLERRADIFFSIFIPKSLEDKFGGVWNIIVPEFPLLHQYVKGRKKNREIIKRERKPALSNNADYLVSNGNNLFLLEIKTDKNSIDCKQIKYLRTAVNTLFQELVEDIKLIMTRTIATEKYGKLISIIDNEDLKKLKIENVIYVSPDLLKYEENKIKEFKHLSFTDIIQTLKKNANKTRLEEEMIKSLELWNK